MPGNRGSGYTPVPNAVLDEWMPRLKDSEFRLLALVLRSTLGWRKERDWLSHAQLCKRTGRGSDAVSAALRSLVGHGLVTVETAGGTPVPTSEGRRRYVGRLYLRPGPSVDSCGKVENGGTVPSGKSRNDKRQVR